MGKLTGKLKYLSLGLLIIGTSGAYAFRMIEASRYWETVLRGPLMFLLKGTASLFFWTVFFKDVYKANNFGRWSVSLWGRGQIFFLPRTTKIRSLSGAKVEHCFLTVPLKECFLSSVRHLRHKSPCVQHPPGLLGTACLGKGARRISVNMKPEGPAYGE